MSSRNDVWNEHHDVGHSIKSDEKGKAGGKKQKSVLSFEPVMSQNNDILVRMPEHILEFLGTCEAKKWTPSIHAPVFKLSS